MKFLILFACALATASAGHIVAPLAHVYTTPQHLPIIGADGVPVDTAEVQHARNAHAVHKADAIARNGDYIHAAYYSHAAPILSTHAEHIVPAYTTPHAYPTTAVYPAAVNGVPLETPEVVAAKSHHFAAHAEALVRNAHGVHHLARRGIYAASPLAYTYHGYQSQHLPIIGADGVPVDTAEVQHAKVAHAVHKADAIARNGEYVHAAYYAHATPVVAAYVAPHAYPTTAVHPAAINGVPLETPEVVAAKSHHFAAHAEALARNAHGVHHLVRRGIYAASPLAYSYHQSQHLPIIGADGVPVDTAEVQHARAAHSVHKAVAHARNGDYAYGAYTHAPVVATSYAHAPVVATPYSHAPFVAATYGAHSYAAPWAY